MSKLTKKLLALSLLTVGLSILLGLLGTLSRERAARRESVVYDIASSSAGEQTLLGPVLLDEVEVSRGDARVVEHRYRHPRALEVTAEVDVEPRRRGIFVVPTFTASHALTGSFDPAPAGAEGEVLRSTRLVLEVSDPRGIARPPTLRFGGVDASFVPGGGLSRQGVHAALSPEDAARGGAFEIQLDLKGTRELRWAPIAGDAAVSVRSAWPHPSFVGASLPVDRRVGASGFEATWRANPFQSGASLSGALADASLGVPGGQAFGLLLVSPGDTYVQVERAIKYGFLFVALTFAAFAVFETMRRLPIHVVQYAMVGVALVLFFLLLLSLAEHVSFGSAYAIAAAACIGLLTFYLRHVIDGWGRSAAFGAMFAALYGTLFVLLRLEEYALLVGSGVLFGLLAVAMVVTRRVDWFAVVEAPPAPVVNHPYRGMPSAPFGEPG